MPRRHRSTQQLTDVENFTSAPVPQPCLRAVIALAAQTIVMSDASERGLIDPQVVTTTPEGCCCATAKAPDSSPAWPKPAERGRTVITQDVADVLGTDLGQAVVANAATQVLLKQAPRPSTPSATRSGSPLANAACSSPPASAPGSSSVAPTRPASKPSPPMPSTDCAPLVWSWSTLVGDCD